jgi:hypothetical protein
VLELIVQQTNSTVATTVVQQTLGASLFGLPLTDIITACAGIAVAFFGFVTLWVAQKNRKKQSIEKQLEKLYNPMYEIMDWAVREQSASDKAQQIIGVYPREYEELLTVFLGYGHYLHPEKHEEIKQLLVSPVSKGYVRTYPEEAFEKALTSITVSRARLMVDLYRLRGFPWRLKDSSGKEIL